MTITFIALSESTSNKGVVIPFVQFNVTYMLLLILLVCIVLILLYKQFSFDVLFSGRFSLFGRVLGFVQEHLFFGNGVSYDKLGNMRSHNVILQILYENGLVGFIGFIFFCIVAFNRIFERMGDNKYYFGFACAVTFIIVNGLGEEAIFSRFIMLFGLVFLASMKQNRDREGDRSV